MADYAEIDVNNLLSGEPWTTALANATFENPEAIAEGAPGAPKIRTSSLAPNVISVTGDAAVSNGTEGAIYTYHITGTAGGAGSYTIRYRTSTDGGTSKTSWTNLLSASYASSDVVGVSGSGALAFPNNTDYVEVGATWSGSALGIASSGVMTLFGDITIG